MRTKLMEKLLKTSLYQASQWAFGSTVDIARARIALWSFEAWRCQTSSPPVSEAMDLKVICALSVILIVSLSTFAEGKKLPTSCQCKMAPRERKNCGYPGISPEECKKAGCCFSNSVAGVPWCFAPKAKKGNISARNTDLPSDSLLPLFLLYAVKKVCPNNPHARVNCGFPGISAKDCERKGCCFRAQPAGVPWCFYHHMVEEGNVLHETSSPPQLLAGSMLCPGLVSCASLARRGGASRMGSPPFPVWVQSFLTPSVSGKEVAKP
ncbi:uncharacterized protein ACIBXB_017509 [Morphnus guianensis]